MAMDGPNLEFGRAVTEAIRWLGCTPLTAGQALGIQEATLNAMCRGIVPMRSLVIRFGSEVSRRAQDREGAPAWWHDVDAWLAMAGYPPRRDRPVPLNRSSGAGAPGRLSGAEEPPGTDRGADEPAANYYRPVYERLPWGDTHVHIFWLLDRNDEKTHQFRFPAPVDYQRRAAELKHDLHSMSRARFERRYARYRLESVG